MAMMCPMNGCKAERGLCIHEKMMIAMGLLGVVGAVAHFGLHWL